MGIILSIGHQVMGAGLGVMGWIGVIGLLALCVLVVRCLMSRRVLAVAKLTWKAAFRFRVFWVMAILLLVAVAGLPSMLKGDGTAEGLVQIIITYTLSMVFLFLGAGTLWMSAGSMANDIENYHIQMIATKPIARWEIWLGKWIGIMSLNLALLVLSGVVVYGMVEYRANKLTWDELKRIEPQTDTEVLLTAMNNRLPVLVDDPETGEFLNASKPQPLFEEARAAIAAQAPHFLGYIQHHMNTHQGQEPLFRPIEDIRQDVASMEETKLRNEVLIGRDSFQLNEVLHARAVAPQEIISAQPDFFKPLKSKYEGLMEETVETMIAEHIALLQEQQAYYDKAGVKAVVPTEITAKEKIVFEARADVMLRLRSQRLMPGEGFVFVYDIPSGTKLPKTERLHWQLEFEDVSVGYRTDRPYYVIVLHGTGLPPVADKTESNLKARTVNNVEMGHLVHGESGLTSIIEGNDKLYIYFRNGADHQNIPADQRYMLKVPFLDDMTGALNPDKLQLLYRESGFAVNFFRSLLILYAWLGILAALGLFAASFMSFPMAAFSCLGVLVMSFCTGLMEDVLEDETIMQTYTMGERDTSIVDLYAIPAFKVITTLVSPMKDYSPVEDLATGRSVNWGETVRAYAFIWGISGWILGLTGAIVFNRRQLAITSAQGP